MSSTRLPSPAAWASQRKALHARWQALALRERRLLALTALAVAALLLWLVAIQPAWRSLRAAPPRLAQLEAQLQNMRMLAAEASELRSAPPLSSDAQAAALKSASERLGGKARLQLQGDRAVVTLTGLSSSELRDWLTAARSGARARPVEAKLSRSGDAYSGSVVLSLGAAP